MSEPKHEIALEKVPEKDSAIAQNTSGQGNPESSHPQPEVYMKGLRLGSTILALALGTLLVAIDNTVIAVAIPKLSSVFKSLDQVGWYGSAYLLTVTALQPTSGRLYKFFDLKHTFICSVLVFEVGSVLCAAAPNSLTFILGRAIAGIGAAGILQGGLAIIGAIVPLQRRPLYISVVLSVFGLATCFGPVLGGAFTTSVSWRWCFYINLPIGFVSLLLILVCFNRQNTVTEDRNLPTKVKVQRLDLLGATLLISGLCCLLLALQWAGTSQPWRSSKIIGLFIGFGLILGCFFFLQWRLGSNSTMPLQVLFQRSIAFGSAFELLVNMSNYAIGYFLPFYFQAVQGVSATQSGIRFIALAFPEVFAIVLMGVVVTKTGYYVSIKSLPMSNLREVVNDLWKKAPFMFLGAAVAIVGTALLCRIGLETSTVEWAAYCVITGIGIGIGIQLPYTAVQAVLNEDDIPSGNGILLLFQQLGGAIAIPIGNTIFVNSLLSEVPKHTNAIAPSAVVAAGAANLKQVAADLHTFIALQLSYSQAVRNTMYLALATISLAFLLAAGLERKNLRRVAAKRKQAQEEQVEDP